MHSRCRITRRALTRYRIRVLQVRHTPKLANGWQMLFAKFSFQERAEPMNKRAAFQGARDHGTARVLYARYFSDRIWFFTCRRCAGITYQSTMGHRWDRAARQIEKLRARLRWRANDTVPIKPRGMHRRTYQRILGMLAYHEAIRKQGASYSRKERPEQHRTHLWRQCRNRFAVLGGWPVR
jgi:hypothetical protein